MDIIKYINDKNYYICEYEKIKSIIKSNIANGIDDYDSNGFINLKKKKIVLSAIIYTMLLIISFVGASIALNKTGEYTPNHNIYNNNLIEYYEYFDTIIACGPRQKGLGKINMLYKTDIISDEDKEELKLYEQEIKQNDLYNDVGFSISLGIKNGKDEVYIVCYPVYDAVKVSKIKKWFDPSILYKGKKIFIFESNLSFSLQSIRDYMEDWMKQNNVSSMEIENIITDYDGIYGSYYGTILVDISYMKIGYARTQEEYDIKEMEADVNCLFRYGYYYGDESEFGVRKSKTCYIDEEGIKEYENQKKGIG